MAIEPAVNAVINLIEKNIIARTNVVSNAITGSNVISVENSFRFNEGEEIVLIDYGYNIPGSAHYQVFEYAKIDTVSNTHSIILQQPLEGTWETASNAFVQKTIGHSPLYEDQIYYGDREVIPTDLMAITVEPVSVNNEWIYLPGGLSEEYRLKVTIYGKDVKTDEGRRILDRYSDAVYKLLNNNLHININDYSAPLVANVASGSSSIVELRAKLTV